jgi:hypothetical protein
MFLEWIQNPSLYFQCVHLFKAGFLSALPYLTMAIVLYSSGYMSDYLIEKRQVQYTTVRKLFCCTGKDNCLPGNFVSILSFSSFSFLHATKYKAYCCSLYL